MSLAHSTKFQGFIQSTGLGLRAESIIEYAARYTWPGQNVVVSSMQ